jgi:hypothetical protein
MEWGIGGELSGLVVTNAVLGLAVSSLVGVFLYAVLRQLWSSRAAGLHPPVSGKPDLMVIRGGKPAATPRFSPNLGRRRSQGRALP